MGDGLPVGKMSEGERMSEESDIKANQAIRRKRLYESIEEEYQFYANELQKYATWVTDHAQNFSDWVMGDDLHSARYHLDAIQARVKDSYSLIEEMERLNERYPNRTQYLQEQVTSGEDNGVATER